MKEPVDYAALCKLAVDYSDGVIQNSEKVDESIIEYARQSGKLVLDYQNLKTMQMPATSSTIRYGMRLQTKKNKKIKIRRS